LQLTELRNLPSWVINWSRPIWIQHHFGRTEGKDLKPLYSASSAVSQSIPIRLWTKSKSLAVSGYVIDMIPKTTRTKTTRNPTRWRRSQWIEEICELVVEICQERPLTKERQENLILRTAVADCITGPYWPDYHRIQSLDLEKLSALRLIIRRKLDSGKLDDESSKWMEASNTWYFMTLDSVSQYGQPMLSKNYRIGIGPRGFQAGDLICSFPGASTPFVLRKRNQDGYWLLGWVYLHGVMDGEAMSDIYETETFTIH
jgi:hypothetical protein